MKKHQPSQPSGFNPEDLYAKVNKNPHRGQPSQPLEEVGTGASNRRPLQQPANSVYATLGTSENPQRPLSDPGPVSEGVYKPQKPMAGPYSQPRGRQGPQEPHLYEEISQNNQGRRPLQQPANSVYATLGMDGNPQRPVSDPGPLSEGYRPQSPMAGPYSQPRGRQGPQEPHLYEEIGQNNQSRQPLQQPASSIYTTLGMGASPQGARAGPSSLSESDDSTQRPVESPYSIPRGTPAPQGVETNPYSIPRGTPAPQGVETSLYSIPRGAPLSQEENPYRPQNPTGINPLSEGGGYRPQGIVMPPSPPTSRRPPHPQRGVDPYRVTSLFGDDGQDPPGIGVGPYSVVDLFDKDGQGPKNPDENPYEEVNARKLPSPSREASITKALGEHVKVQYGRAEVQHWCGLVYGNNGALDAQLAQVLESPRKAEEVLYGLLENPETGGKLAGREVLGIKSPGRREAEEDFRPLCAAFERYVSTVQKLHKEISQQHAKGHGQRREPEGQERDAEHKHHHHHHHRRSQGQHSPEREERQQRENSPTRGAAAFAL